ncbi:MAG: molybdopterin molybdotransferase MoeA [Acidobacteria bacterium]|nr:molybdopterin molybdotransferase MoeA [Acidobacteriota bacterium]MBI3662460.1 molybdopterin molybdotransferase MoeA [Acidobacteriota bacterium]
MLPYAEARRKVVEAVSTRCPAPRREVVALHRALGRILAGEVRADRDYPPFDRSTRDGFAVRAADLATLPVTLQIIAEIKAGDTFSGEVRAGQCAQIMTGAAVPAGADAVVMIEHTRPSGASVVMERKVAPGENIVPRGSESKAGKILLQPGARLGYAELALLGQVGCADVNVYRRPRVAILSTGDEVVEVGQQPGPFQIRNSNTVSLAAQVELAGGEPVPLPNAPDEATKLRALIERGLEDDILVLSGGVSMGKYDLVETVLRDMGAEFFFDAVAIRPGKPAVFGTCNGKFVFGLPGNPVSTMVTFELFVVPAIDMLNGAAPRPLPFFKAKLAAPVKQKATLTHFLPANVEWSTGEPVVKELPWQGSGDIVALAQANCYLVVPETRLESAAGDWVDVLPRRGVL